MAIASSNKKREEYGHVDTRFRGYQQHRSCGRPGCALTASATLTYDYAKHTVWIDNLFDEPHPATYDLCGRHTERSYGLQGWDFVDRRHTLPQVVHTKLFADAS